LASVSRQSASSVWKARARWKVRIQRVRIMSELTKTYALTLTLSPGRGDRHRSRSDISAVVEITPALATILPLPGGEGCCPTGRSEGEPILKLTRCTATVSPAPISDVMPIRGRYTKWSETREMERKYMSKKPNTGNKFTVKNPGPKRSAQAQRLFPFS